MRSAPLTARRSSTALPKAPTGIRGVDEITRGGLPRGRPTLVCGSAGCGKTLFAAEFLIRGATEHGEPGVFVAFEETAEELAANVRSLGFDLDRLVRERKLSIDHVRVDRSEIEESGEYNLDGLFIRLAHAIDSIRAKRVVLDTIETLFSGLANHAVLRAELRRLFGWLKTKGVTAIITGETGVGQLTRQGLEEYISDCVIFLDNRVVDQVTTRRLRIVKYRGSAHGTNEFPFVIDEHGFSVLPITTLGLDHTVSAERVSTGVRGLDEMLGGEGLFRGTSVLVSGTAGTGKTSIGAHFLDAACRRGEQALLLAYEESAPQILRNMRSIGLDLASWVKQGRLHISTIRPYAHGLETHLVAIHKLLEDHQPATVVIDPVSNLTAAGAQLETTAMLVRLIDLLKTRGVTTLLTTLTSGSAALETTSTDVSSLIDTWLLVRAVEHAGERNRELYVLKSRGMAHSNQLREVRISARGVELLPAYVGPGGVLTGSARLAQEAHDREAELARRDEAAREELALRAKHAATAAQIASLQAELAALGQELEQSAAAEVDRRSRMTSDQQAMARNRGVASADRPPPRARRRR